jgi:hypothetical protein
MDRSQSLFSKAPATEAPDRSKIGFLQARVTNELAGSPRRRALPFFKEILTKDSKGSSGQAPAQPVQPDVSYETQASLFSMWNSLRDEVRTVRALRTETL